MSLVIAIVMIIIVSCIKWKDFAVTSRIDAQMRYREDSIFEFEKKYTSLSLERELTVSKEEVEQAISEMRKYGQIDSESYIMNNWWIDIMLANRGKVSHRAYLFGYKAHWKLEHNKLTPQTILEQQYAFIAWMRDTLKKHGVFLTPVYILDLPSASFAWVGSRASPVTDTSLNSRGLRMKFTEELKEPYKE